MVPVCPVLNSMLAYVEVLTCSLPTIRALAAKGNPLTSTLSPKALHLTSAHTVVSMDWLNPTTTPLFQPFWYVVLITTWQHMYKTQCTSMVPQETNMIDNNPLILLTTFEPKQCKQQVCKAKVKNRVDQALELKCWKQGKMC